jgi:hypothetical protein
LLPGPHGLRERDAADVILALASPEACGLLGCEGGWSREHYEAVDGDPRRQLLS